MSEDIQNPAQELTAVGQKLAELGTKLLALRRQRDEANRQISELEAQVNPLIKKHTELISQMMGIVIAPVPPQPPPQYAAPNYASQGPGAVPPQIGAISPSQQGMQPSGDWISQRKDLEKRIRMYLNSLDEEAKAGAEDIAKALKVPLMQVREALGGLNRRAPGGGPSVPIPDEPERPIDDTPISLGPPDGEFDIPGGVPLQK
jgi:hypothetical protein